MARSPFQGTWQDGVRPTVAMAPDAKVYINGSPLVLGCTECRRRFDINKYVTSVQVDLNVESAPGSASVNLSLPRHMVDEFFFEGEPIITPMMEIEIYAKGYFLVEGVPQYYPIFWGLVTEVTDNYSGGEHTVSLSCSDILKWWELCKMNVNPAFSQPAPQLGRDYIYGSLFKANIYDIIWTLAQQSFGDIVHATGSLTSTFKEQSKRATFDKAMGSIVSYWTERFSQMRSNLLLYGVRGGAVRGDMLYASSGKGVQKYASQAVRSANGGSDGSQLYFDPDDVIPFRSNLSDAAQINFYQSEFQSKLEIANACKEAAGFEFYMDVTGDIVFKPPFFNLDTLGNKPTSWIQDIDIIDWNFSKSEAEVVTHLQMQGSFEGGPMDYGITSDYNTPFQQVIDYHLLKDYGWRTQTFNAEYMADANSMFWTGVDMLDRFNSKRHRATVTIPIRPELRLGFPLYIAPKDQMWYLQGLSHSITMGGRAQTQLTLTAKRGKFVAPRGIGSLDITSKKAKNYKVNVGDAAQLPYQGTDPVPDKDPYAPMVMRHPKTGRLVGYPNVALAYTLDYSPSLEDIQKDLGQKTGTDRGVAPKQRDIQGNARGKNAEIQQEAFGQTTQRTLTDRHMNNRYFRGMTSAGVYTYVHDRSKTIQELVSIPAKNIEATSNSLGGASLKEEALFGKTAMIRPVSDERGFELIGHFRYGRGTALRDGSLILDLQEGDRPRAAVDTQLALSGSLISSLNAQSQGLTTLTSGYANPAAAISRLQPSDLETSLDPTFGGMGMLQAGDENFVSTAPLGSAEDSGLPTNVEASQLSNALTLAEMAPDGGTDIDPNCGCLSGRADLAFINVGYQVEVLKYAAATDGSKLATINGSGKSGPATTLADLDKQIAALEAQKAFGEENDPLRETDPVAFQGVLAGYDDQIVDLLLQRERVSLENLGHSFEALGGSVTPSSSLSTSKIDTFLANLYEALDEPHQNFEKEVRGQLIPGPTRTEVISGTAVPGEDEAFGEFRPPFSPLGRARGGDLDALARQGSTAVADLGSSWKEFGENLQDNTRIGELQSEISILEVRIADLNREEEDIQEALDSGSTVISPDGSITERLENLEAERSQARRELRNAEAKLQVIRNKKGQA
jgi:hypothetical protein